MVDEDTNSFNKIIEGFRMPKATSEEKEIRQKAIQDATKYATEIPLEVMKTAYDSMEVMQAMLENGLQSSLSDAGVGILCARASVVGAYFNVRINAKDIKDKEFSEDILKNAKDIYNKTIALEQEVMTFMDSKI